MNKLSKSLIIAAVATFVSGSAMAFQGFSFGIMGTAADFTTTGHEKEGYADGGAAADMDIETSSTVTHGESAGYGSIFVEWSGGEANSIGYTVGLEYVPGEASLGSKVRADTASVSGAETNTETNKDNKTYEAKARISNFTTFYFEPTYMYGENVGVYLKGAVSRLTIETLEDLASGTDSSTYGDEDILGASYGIGVKMVTPIGIFFKTEFTKSVFESVKLVSTTGNKNRIEATPESTNFRLGLGFNF